MTNSDSKAWAADKRNTLTVTQKGKHCGTICKTVKIDAQEIDDDVRAKAEAMLKGDPQHQTGYFDIYLRTAWGTELDFETAIL